MAERVRVREIDDDEGRRLLQIIRRGTGSVVTWRRAQMVLLSAQGLPVAKIANSKPAERGLPFSTWSLAKLAGFMVAEGVVDDISHEGLRILLREEGVSFEFQAYGSGGGAPPGNGIPDPTATCLEAANGPMTTATYTVPGPSGYGSGTVTYPTSSGSYPGAVLMPSYQGTQQNLWWLAPRLASWSFVVVNVGTNTLTDDPESRGRQISAAGTQLIALGNAAGNPLSGKVNGTLGAVGHSMGGGGVMAALRDDSRLRAGVPTAPYHPNVNFSAVTEPTFFLTCQSGSVAHGNTYAVPWYNSMSQAEKLYGEVPGDHLCPMTGSGNKAKQGKWIVMFLSLWLRADTRFGPFLCGLVRDPDKNNTSLVTRWMDTCSF